MTNRLVEICRKDLPILKNLYSPNGVKNSFLAYLVIDNYIRWFKENSNLKHVKFFCLNGNFSDGTFVITDKSSAYADTANESHENLFELLLLIDYSKSYRFLNIRPEIQPIIINALDKANVEIAIDNKTLLFCLPKEEALKLDVSPPNGIELRPLTELHDLEKADSVWPHRCCDSLTLFKRFAKYNLNIGAFTSDGTLVAWVLRYSTGLVGILQTDENHSGKGYGSLVIRAISRKIAETGDNGYVGILEQNIQSRSIFEKMGYKRIGEIHYIISKMYWSEGDD